MLDCARVAKTYGVMNLGTRRTISAVLTVSSMYSRADCINFSSRTRIKRSVTLSS